jgi:hypothetical protein
LLKQSEVSPWDNDEQNKYSDVDCMNKDDGHESGEREVTKSLDNKNSNLEQLELDNIELIAKLQTTERELQILRNSRKDSDTFDKDRFRD